MKRKIVKKPELDIYELRNFDESQVLDLVVRLRKEKLRYNQEIIANKISLFKSETTAELVFPLLRSEDACLRNTAIEILSSIGNASINLCEQNFCDKNKDIRKFILDILRNIKSKQSSALVVKFLNDKDENVLQTAIEIIGLKTYFSAFDKLIEILNSTESIWVLNSLINTFGLLGQKDALKYINNKLDNYHVANKFEMNIIINSYIKSLGNIGTYSDLENVFQRYLKQYEITDENLLNCVSSIVSRHDASDIESCLLSKIKEVYINKLKYTDPELALFSLKMMLKLGFDFFLENVIDLIKNFSGTEFFAESLFEVIVELNDLPKSFIESLLEDEDYSVKDFGVKLIEAKNLSGFETNKIDQLPVKKKIVRHAFKKISNPST